MIRFQFFKKDRDRKLDPVNDLIRKIRNGDAALRENFIKDYLPLIIKLVSQFTGEYVQVENSEEFSVGLSAFNEAIDSFNENMNCSFITFATQVIRRRLLNYSSRNQRKYKELPFTYFQTDENNSFEEKYLSIDPSDQFRKIEVTEQVLQYQKKLEEFGISIRDLVRLAPKHKDSKQLSIQIARTLSSNDDLYQQLIKKKNLPMTELLKVSNVSQRTLERNRKFIIAVCLILKGEFDVFSDLVSENQKGGEAIESDRNHY